MDQYSASAVGEPNAETPLDDTSLDAVAVVGMALRVPGADSPVQFWANLVGGVESITRFTDAQLAEAGVPEARRGDPNFVPARGIIANAECFDAAFFGYSAREAELMDPQHRVFLECCWHAIEHAGYAPRNVPGAVGVWAGSSTGMSNNTYLHSNLQGNPAVDVHEEATPLLIGNENDYLTTRVSYKLDLRGPSVNVQTACSTSLVAITQAYQALMTYGCDMALAGGVSLSYPQVDGYEYQEGGIGSPDGHCRPFDVQSAGTVFSNGVGVVVLKRLEEAKAAGDTIYAVLRGAAMNNDGAAKMSFAAPSVDGQAEAIATAQAIAGVSPESVTYVECHGTATPIGDPIEIAALTKAFGTGARSTVCWLGSVKSNFGHLDSAAGVAGFIKTVLALHHRQLPPTLHFTAPNPALALERTPFRVNDTLRAWEAPSPRRAGVSGFGIGGTNVHLVLEEAPRATVAAPGIAAGEVQLLPLSARTEEALNAATSRLVEHLRAQPPLSLADAAFTLQEGREPFAFRRTVAAADVAGAIAALEKSRTGVVRRVGVGAPDIAMLFAGGGSQYVGMARALYERFPVVRPCIDEGLQWYQAYTGVDLRRVWFADAHDVAARAEFERPSLQLPAIFLTQVALVRLLAEVGVTPSALIGHSLGENTAAHIAGVLSFEEALGLVTLRGQLFEQVPPGGMLSVSAPVASVRGWLGADLDLATVNGAEQCTVSGTREALAVFAQRLEAEGVEYQTIPIAIAAHSRLLDPILPAFRAYLQRCTLQAPAVPIVSNLTGTWLTAAQAQDPEYWVQHLRNTVLFADGVALLGSHDHRVLLDVGPGRVLSSLARLSGAVAADRIIGCTRHPEDPSDDVSLLLTGVGSLWSAGVPVDFAAVRTLGGGAHSPARRIALPGYPFERTRYYIAPPVAPPVAASVAPSVAPSVAQPVAPSVAPSEGPLVASLPHDHAVMSRRTYIQNRLQQLLHELSGLALDRIEVSATFLDMGFDSLFLTQANLRFRKEFNVRVTFRQLFDEAPTIAALAEYIDGQLPADALQAEVAKVSAVSAPAAAAASAPVTTGAVAAAGALSPVAGDALQQAIALQIQANTALLSVLQGGAPTAVASAPAPAAPLSGPMSSAPAAPSRPRFKPTVSRPAATGRFGPFKPVQKQLSAALSAEQEAYLQEFMTRLQAKTPSSKAYTAQHRAHFADPRAVSGFKQAWKEITYPIVGDRSKGALMWDVDGNEYIDCAGGFGATFFGHAPEFLVDAVRTQMERSLDYAPQSLLAGPTAQLICELTGHDRAAFCNTGSEAVLAAMRMARTVTGNDTIVSFYGSYHGMFDEVLVRPQEINGERVNKPVAPGIPEQASRNMVVLEYGDPASLAYIEQIAGELAAVIVEPIQSRNPELQPVAFVRELRALTERLGIPLIFDEIICGFRLHPRGAQAWYGVDADLCAYGKVVGGGMPVGVVAGKAQFMDALDGGGWQYGDESFPEAGVTYFAGTFVRHPTALAAVHAAMSRLKECGPDLQAQLNRRTALFCERVNRAYHELGVPIEVTYFASVVLPRWYGNPDFESLYFHHLRFHGAHIWEGRPAFFSTEHTDAHFARLLDIFVAAARDLQRAGFLPLPEQTVAETRGFTAAQQEVYLALAMGNDARAAFNEQVLFDFDAELDAEVLELTLDKVVNRHASLRAVVRADGTGLDIHRYMAPTFAVVDLSQRTVAEADVLAERLARTQVDAVFDLERGPLVRLLVIRLPQRRTRLALAACHLVCDGWSLEVVMQDLAHYYEAMREGRQVDRGTPPSLGDFAGVMSERVSSEDHALARNWWREQFTPLPPVVQLPFDKPRPPVKSYRGERQRVTLGADVAEPLRAFARAQGCTLFVAALTAYELLLHKLSGSDDLVVGIPSAGQPATGLTALVAHDVRFLPLRAKLGRSDTIAAFMQTLRRTMNEAQEYRDLTYGDLLQELRPPRDASRLPLLTAAFNMDLEMSPLWFHGARGQFVTTPRSCVKYDLFFNVIDHGAGQGISLEVDYNSDLLHAATASRWTAMYLALLEQLPSLGDTPVGAVTLASRAAQETVDGSAVASLTGATTDALTAPHTLVSLFESAVDAHPGRTAVVMDGGDSYTYAALDARANQVAHWLQREGVGPNDVVALLFDRSLSLMDAVYGTVKSGAAYLPLDPGNPAARLAEIVQAAKPTLLLCTQVDLPKVAAWVPMGVEIRAIDAPDAPWRTAPITRPSRTVDPSQLAYVIYTSGSTGKPKGVMVEHRAIASRLRWAQRATPLDVSDSVLQKTAYTFDVSVWELFWPLQIGARLVLALPGGHKDPRYLREVIERERITVLHFVPSMLGVFLAELGGATLDGPRLVLCSGEALTAAHRDRFFAAAPSSRLVNLYGPTEAAVDVTWWECERSHNEATIPIGLPVDDTQLRVLDEHGQAVPHGVAGELYISGVQLARGYLHDEARTADAFVSITVNAQSVRAYRTGDLVRQRHDGALEFLGRRDHQVKLRGFRIELGEIEAKLTAVEGVQTAAVLVVKQGEGDDRLVAFVQPALDTALSQLTLRRALANTLPEYMVPSVFTVLEHMPLNSSGKIDRQALQAQYAVAAAPSAGGAYRAPSTPAEQRVAAIWSAALKAERISADAYFFDAGGHSLLAVGVAREMEQALGRRYDLRELLMSNLGQLAALAEQRDRDHRDSDDRDTGAA